MAEQKECCESTRDAAIRNYQEGVNSLGRGAINNRDLVARIESYPKDVTITQVDNGFIVRVGCKTFVGKDWDDVSNGLDAYFIDPAAAEKLYCK